MRLILWTLSFLLLGLWSLFAWAATGLIGFAEAWTATVVGDPLSLGLAMANLSDWLGPVGTTTIVAIWAAGAIALLLGTFVLSRLLRTAGRLARGRTNSIGSMRHVSAGYHRPAGSDRWASRLSPFLMRLARR